MKIFITGITGFTGKHLAKYLVSKNYNIKGIGRKEFSLEGVEYKKLDLLKDQNQIKEFTEDCDCFIHLAGMTDVPETENNSYLTYDINAIGTYNLLKTFNESKAKKFIFTSTGYLYREVEYLPVDEKHPINLDHPYSNSKYLAEEFIKLLSKPSKNYLILRPFNLFGPNQTARIIPSILNQIKESNILSLGNVHVKRDFLHLDDFSELETEISKKINLYNVGSGKSISIKEIVNKIAKISNKKLEVKIDPEKVRKNETVDLYADITKIKNDFDWQPQISIEEGLEKMMSN
jgi:nucleoside-diphosphate-sugar epimerase